MDSILQGATWRKSSRSGNSGGSCVELACAPEVIAVRDSKNPAGPILRFDPARLAAFVASVRHGRFDA